MKKDNEDPELERENYGQVVRYLPCALHLTTVLDGAQIFILYRRQ